MITNSWRSLPQHWQRRRRRFLGSLPHISVRHATHRPDYCWPLNRDGTLDVGTASTPGSRNCVKPAMDSILDRASAGRARAPMPTMLGCTTSSRPCDGGARNLPRRQRAPSLGRRHHGCGAFHGRARRRREGASPSQREPFALRLALLTAGVGPGDEVLVSCGRLDRGECGSREPRCAAGPRAPGRFDPHYGPPCRGALPLTSSTRAAIVTHLHGVCADIDAILGRHRSGGVTIVEDAAQALSAVRRDRPAGTTRRCRRIFARSWQSCGGWRAPSSRDRQTGSRRSARERIPSVSSWH